MTANAFRSATPNNAPRPSGSTSPTNPYDPHHVTMQLLIDLQSTNLVRQQEILRLRSDLESSRSWGDEQRMRADNAETRVRQAIEFIRQPERPTDSWDIMLRLLEPPQEP